MLKRLDEDQTIERLRQGGVVVFPTETSYSLGCRAGDATAVARLVALKGRPDGRPLPVLLPSMRALERHQPETPLLALAQAFWPGPLTLVVPAFPGLAQAVTGATNMVGVRLSGHEVAARIAHALGEPVVATSANRSGAAAPSTAEGCDAAGLDGADGLLDAGPVPGSKSTVVGIVDGALHVFREGPIAAASLRAAWASRLN
jgi:L-threonylcarbamoyladenylate synthase